MNSTPPSNEFEIIVSSIGRSGSTLVTDLICNATGREKKFSENICDNNGYIKKTHSPLYEEPPFAYKAIFVNGDIGDAISSMYIRRVNLKKHLNHLHVRKRHRVVFRILIRLSRNLAFRYIINGDKLRFKENIRSWQESKHTLCIDYADLINQKEQTLALISHFLGTEVPDFTVRKRKSSKNLLPAGIVNRIEKEYTIR